MFCCVAPPQAVQQFFRYHHPNLEAIIPDAAELSGEWAPTTLRGPAAISLGEVDLFVAGFVCCARAKPNAKRAGPSCVRDGVGTSTGDSFSHISGFIKIHLPRHFVLENVVFRVVVSAPSVLF